MPQYEIETDKGTYLVETAEEAAAPSVPDKAPGMMEQLYKKLPEGSFLRQQAEDPNSPLRQMYRRAPGMAAGAQVGGALGSMLAPGPGTAIGGTVGAAAGAFLPPSETPTTDLAAQAASFGASKFFPINKVNSALTNFLSGSGRVASVALGAELGQMGDQKANFVGNANGFQVAVYAGTEALPLALRELIPPSSAQLASQRLAKFTGTKAIPLSIPEMIEGSGVGSDMSSIFTKGSPMGKWLGSQQNANAISAAEKVVNGVILDAKKTVEAGWEAKSSVRGVVDAFKKLYSNKGIRTNWEEFRGMYGMSRDEAASFFKVLRGSPDTFVDAFLPTGKETSTKGTLALNGFMSVLNAEDPAAAGKFGDAIITRLISRGGGVVDSAKFGKVINGESFYRALFTTFGEERLTQVLGAPRAEAMKDLATVMSLTDPAQKIAPDQVGQQKRTLVYLYNKYMFAITAGGSMAGGAITHGVAGATVAVSASAVISTLMQTPALGKVLLKAAQGDSAATSQFLRAMLSPTSSQDEKDQGKTKARVMLGAALRPVAKKPGLDKMFNPE